MKFIMEKVFSSSTLPNTIKITSFIGFQYLDKCVAKMTFEAKYPYNLIIGLQSSIGCRALWLLLFIVRQKKKLVNQVVLKLANRQLRYCLLISA
jgi:hypothetical protein